jgi:hypothetical protein
VEVKKLKNDFLPNAGRKIVEMVEFEEAEAEKLELIKRQTGLKQNKEVIKTLISEKYDAIKLQEEKQGKRQVEEAKAIEYLEKGEYECPM